MTSALPALAAFVPLGAAVALGAFSGKARRSIVDAFSLAAAAATAVLIGVLVLAALLFSWRYLESGHNHFHVLMFLFEGGMIGFALSGDFFILFVFFELMGVAAYALTGLKVGERGPLQGAINFAVINSVGSFALLLGIGLLYGRTGALNFAQIGNALARHHATDVVVVAFVLIVVGLFVKAAIVPFHFWLSDAHAVAPTPACVLFSGVMVMLGLYGVARVYWTAFEGAMSHAQHALGLVLIGAGIVSIVVGSVMCFVQRHLKRLLAFSTIAHGGVVLVGIGLMSREGLAGAAVYVAGHGTVKAALFVLAGVVLHRLGAMEERHLHGRGRGLWLTGALFAVGGVALAGLPPFGIEVGKSVIEEAGGYGAWMPWVLGFAGVMTGAAVLRAAASIFLGWGPEQDYQRWERRKGREEERETTAAFDRTPAVLMVPAVVLMAAGLALGLWPRVADDAQRASARFENRGTYAAAALDDHDSMRAPKPAETSSTGAWYGAAAAATAVALAAVTLFRRRVSAGIRARLTIAAAPVRALRAAHTGHIGDYAMWFTVGLAAFGGLFILVVR